jgi:hypothetical protein
MLCTKSRESVPASTDFWGKALLWSEGASLRSNYKHLAPVGGKAFEDAASLNSDRFIVLIGENNTSRETLCLSHELVC